MARWMYKTSIVDLDTMIPPDLVTCDATGACFIEGIPGHVESLDGVLSEVGESEWELVQCQSHAGKLLLIWKKAVEEVLGG